MPLQVTYVELYKESRKQQITTNSISKTLVFIMHGEFFNRDPLTGEAPTRSFGGIEEFMDDDEVHLAAYQTFPLYREFEILPNEFVLLILTSLELEQINDESWKVTLVYDLNTDDNGRGLLNDDFRDKNLGPDDGENGGSGWSQELTQLSFNSSLRTVHKTTSLELVAAHKNDTLPAAMSLPLNMIAGRPAPVGYTEEELKGYEGYERQFTFQITKYMSPKKLKYAYVRKIHGMAGTTNKNIFFGFPPGSVLFLGSSGAGDLVQNVPITFEFEVRPNFEFTQGSTVLADPNSNVGVDRLSDPSFPGTSSYSGWSHVDYRYIPVPDGNAKIKIMTPAFRFIHRIVEVSDFNKLEI